MKNWNRSGRILRIRPGHLANFSGGAGYMPFIVMYSVPASFLFNMVGSILLYYRAKGLFANETGSRTELHEFVRYARWHTLGCVVVAATTGVVLFLMANGMVYGNKWQYAAFTFLFSVGPLVAWILSLLVTIWLSLCEGPKWRNLIAGMGIYIVLLCAGIPLVAIVSAITGVSL